MIVFPENAITSSLPESVQFPWVVTPPLTPAKSVKRSILCIELEIQIVRIKF